MYSKKKQIISIKLMIVIQNVIAVKLKHVDKESEINELII